MVIYKIAAQVIREAFARRWILGFFLGINALLILSIFFLRLEIVDGALAATQFFSSFNHSIRSADISLKPVFKAASGIIFYSGLIFGIFSSAGLASTLLNPGRIDLLLAQPVQRWQILLGSYLGTLLLLTLFSFYGCAGFVIIMGFKTDVWIWKLIWTAFFSMVAFSSIYAAMLSIAVFKRYKPLIILSGLLIFCFGIMEYTKNDIAKSFDIFWLGNIFKTILIFMPKTLVLSGHSIEIIYDVKFENIPQFIDSVKYIVPNIFGNLILSLAFLSIGIWHFEKKDF